MTIRDATEADLPAIVAIYNSIIPGRMVTADLEPATVPAYDGTAMIALYVAENHRRTGLGRQLLTRAIAHAPQLGLHTLLGYIFAHNEPSLRFFAAFGFERWAHLPGIARLDGVARDLVILGKRIG